MVKLGPPKLPSYNFIFHLLTDHCTIFYKLHHPCFSTARKVPQGNLTDGLFPTVAKRERKEKDHRRNAAIHGRCSFLFARRSSAAKWFVPFFYCLRKTTIPNSFLLLGDRHAQEVNFSFIHFFLLRRVQIQRTY